MKKRGIMRGGIFFLLVTFILACATGQEEYKIGMQLSAAKKYKEAIAYLEQAIAKEPGNQEYQKSLADLKENLIRDYVDKGSKALSSQSPLNVAAINTAKDQLAKAREIDAGHPEVTRFSGQVDKAQKSLLDEANRLYAETKTLMGGNEWLKAYFNLQQLQTIFPNYEDSFRLLAETSQKGSQSFFQQGKALFDQEDFKGAAENLRKALALKGDHQPSRELLGIAQQQDNKDYFIKQAREAVIAQKWDRAAKSYRRALEYDPDDQELRQLIAQVRVKAGEFYISQARAQMNDGWIFKGFGEFDLAASYIGDPNDFQLNSLRRDLASRAAFLADYFKEQGKFGSAWFWYEKLKKIDPAYKDIFFLSQAMEDEIRTRVQKSIAVFDFGSPSHYSDAGVIVANNLITYLFKNASGDIKILERENLKSILEEMKLGQIGVVSSNTAKEMGRVYGIDVAIMGSVLLYKVDTSISDGTKSVRYQIGTRIQDNINYLNWVAKNPKASESEIKNAPPAKIVAPEYAEKEYKVSHHKKVGFAQLSFRIVDVRTGENIQVRTIESKKTVEDETSAGLPEAKVKFDPLEIATDTELLQQMTDEVVAELGREALRPLQNLENTYSTAGDNYLRRRDTINAAEGYINAVFDEKLKMIQGSPLSKQALEKIDEIFRNYKAQIGG
ncbi:MAG: CsgG/HfaB family protein [Desulfobacterales bacterium]|nr:CsgG/HfaB family protein [Desulfobacterales bacterium]